MDVLIIEDEGPAQKRMQQLVSESPHTLRLVGIATNGNEAIQLIEELQPTAIFLDIQLPDMNGFEILSKIKHKPFIIFTTAYESYALKAFEHLSVDYLLKPIEQERFDVAIEKLRTYQNPPTSETFEKMSAWLTDNRPKKQMAMPIKNRDRIILVNYEEVAYFQSEDKYVNVVLENGQRHLSNKTLSQLEIELPVNFHRVHRSYIINRDFVVELERYFKGRFILKLRDKNKSEIRTGEMYLQKVKDLFNL